MFWHGFEIFQESSIIGRNMRVSFSPFYLFGNTTCDFTKLCSGMVVGSLPSWFYAIFTKIKHGPHQKNGPDTNGHLVIPSTKLPKKWNWEVDQAAVYMNQAVGYDKIMFGDMKFCRFCRFCFMPWKYPIDHVCKPAKTVSCRTSRSSSCFFQSVSSRPFREWNDLYSVQLRHPMSCTNMWTYVLLTI